jgi:hypothetical protein
MELGMNIYRKTLQEENPEALLWDGFDDALIGVIRRACSPSLALYDSGKCIDILVREGMNPEQAAEYLVFNTLEAWGGEGTPYYI